jgi:hypothetical protein
MARRRWIVRLAGIGLARKVEARGVRKDAAKVVGTGVGGVGAMVATGIVDRARRCRFRLRVWRKSLGVLLRRAMRRLRTRCWTRRRVLAGMKKRLVRVLRARMDSAGGVGVADGGGDVALRVRVRRM